MSNKRHVLVIRGREIPLDREVVVGRSQRCDVILHADEEASREHARFGTTPEGVFVEDLNSTNGTFVGSQPVTGKRLIVPPDVVRVGSTLLKVDVVKSNSRPNDQWAEHTPALGIRKVGSGADATQPADIFEVLERVALQAVASGDRDQAERIVAAHLDKLLYEARTGFQNEKHLERAVNIAVALADGAAGARWLNYLIELHDVLERAMPQRVVELLDSAMAARVSGVNFVALRRYCERLDFQSSVQEQAERILVQRIRSLLVMPNSA